MTGCDSPEKGDIFYRSNNKKSYISISDANANSGSAYVKKVVYESMDSITGYGSYTINGSKMTVKMNNGYYFGSGTAIEGSKDGDKIYVPYDACDLSKKHIYIKSSTK